MKVGYKHKILILGVTGMMGHILYKYLDSLENFDVYGTMRSKFESYSNLNLFNEKKIYDNLSTFDIKKFEKTILDLNPDVIINCIGIIKQIDSDPINMIKINSLFPHEISKICSLSNSKFIQISTDCVFSGKNGDYDENSTPDAKDVYGRSKLLGEIYDNNNLTIRTSIIGFELREKKSLLEWFFSEKGNQVDGFENAIYSGLTTLQLSKYLGDIIMNYPKLNGLINLSTNKISKYSLLKIINDIFDLKIVLNKNVNFKNDKSLLNKKAKDIGLIKNDISYEEMLLDLKFF